MVIEFTILLDIENFLKFCEKIWRCFPAKWHFRIKITIQYLCKKILKIFFEEKSQKSRKICIKMEYFLLVSKSAKNVPKCQPENIGAKSI